MILDRELPGPPPTAMVQIDVPMTAKMWAGIQRKAAVAGMPARTYLGLLVGAAYTARVRPQGDLEMEAAVARAFAEVSRRRRTVPAEMPAPVAPDAARPSAAVEAAVAEASVAPVVPSPVGDVLPPPVVAGVAPLLSSAQIRAIKGYRAVGWLPKQIAESLRIDVEAVRAVVYPGRR